MGDTNTRLPAIDPLLAESIRSSIRVRLVLKQGDGDTHPQRIVEGIVLAIVPGRDGRARIRMGIPTGSGDPVEVRVLLDSIERVERVDEAPAVAGPGAPARVNTGAFRRQTLAFGAASSSDATIRTRSAQAIEIARSDSWDDLPGQSDKSSK